MPVPVPLEAFGLLRELAILAAAPPGLVVKLWKRTVVTETGCWEQRRRGGQAIKSGTNGYGRASVEGVPGKTTRFILNTPPDRFACHTCDNTVCWRPSHLWNGTPQENMADCSAKGRNFWANQTHCPLGHPLRVMKANGNRGCRTCVDIATAKCNLRRWYSDLPSWPIVEVLFDQLRGEDIERTTRRKAA